MSEAHEIETLILCAEETCVDDQSNVQIIKMPIQLILMHIDRMTFRSGELCVMFSYIVKN